MKKKLTRSNNRIIAGVCGGIAEYFGLSAKFVRVAYLIFFLICSLFGISSLIPIDLYVILIIILPAAPGPSIFDFSSLFGTQDFSNPVKRAPKNERKIITDVKEKDINQK